MAIPVCIPSTLAINDALRMVHAGQLILAPTWEFGITLYNAIGQTLPSNNQLHTTASPIVEFVRRCEQYAMLARRIMLPWDPTCLVDLPIALREQFDLQEDFATNGNGGFSELIEWINQYYPANRHVHLPLTTLLSLVESLREFHEGTPSFGDEFTIRPLHTVAVPTHVEIPIYRKLFNWINEHRDACGIVKGVDVGCKAGHVSAMLLRAKLMRLLATDSDPNALLSTEDSVNALWTSKRTSSVGRCVETELCGMLPPSWSMMVGGEKQRQSTEFDFAVFHSLLPPLVVHPIGHDAHAKRYAFSLPSMLRRFTSALASSSDCSGLRPNGAVVAVISNNMEELLQKRMNNNGGGGKGAWGKKAAAAYNTSRHPKWIADLMHDCQKASSVSMEVIHHEVVHAGIEPTLGPIFAPQKSPNGPPKFRHLIGNLIVNSTDPSLGAKALAPLQDDFAELCNDLELQLTILSRSVLSTATTDAQRQLKLRRAAELDFKGTIEYAYYAPKEGPSNLHHPFNQMPDYSFLEEDFVDEDNSPRRDSPQSASGSKRQEDVRQVRPIERERVVEGTDVTEDSLRSDYNRRGSSLRKPLWWESPGEKMKQRRREMFLTDREDDGRFDDMNVKLMKFARSGTPAAAKENFSTIFKDEIELVKLRDKQKTKKLHRMALMPQGVRDQFLDQSFMKKNDVVLGVLKDLGEFHDMFNWR